MSLKPFKKTDRAYIKSVCEGVFRQWFPLLKNRECISVMLWVGDGSEILDYSGNMDEEFEWCHFVGTANLPPLAENEPRETSLHKRKQEYMDSPPKMTYGILKTVVEEIKAAGRSAFPNAKIRVGETFDIGPEFAISDFKYNRHPEICSAKGGVDFLKFIDSTALLKGDDRYYAAYPDGIPDGTPFGTFLGKQSDAFLKALGFDYLWLSNGLGFSADPWKLTGKIFDGERYYPERLGDVRQKVHAFWRLFREECDIPLETRGTNNSVGIDYASDGVPLYDIYNDSLGITAPPNSPWAAINDNFGLEIMGHMTRVCELPSEKFPFRYYLHDPWWINSPWYDRYDGAPSDIYLPASISVIDADAQVKCANSLNILSIDNSYGTMPDNCANEVIPHLLRAEKNFPDNPAPFVWIYPLREYTTSFDAELLREMNLGDRFICDEINKGFPLCCVASTDSFLKHSDAVYSKSVIISPVPESGQVMSRLCELSERGIGVIIYGTESKLAALPKSEKIIKLDIEKGDGSLCDSVSGFGYKILFDKREKTTKPPTLTVSESNRALYFSAYNSNTTTVAKFMFPLGAPILCGTEAEIEDGCACYRFERGVSRECRVFVDQQDGVISCREAPPVNARYRRAIKLRGLKDATVILLAEEGCESAVSIAVNTDVTPEFDTRFTRVTDSKYGEILKGEHIDGDIYFLMGRKQNGVK